MNETHLVFFSDKNFTILSDGPFRDDEKSEIISRSLPKGSYWKLYAGGRSLAHFTLNSSHRSALIYSVITDSITVPVINFILLQENYAIAAILRRQLVGIQSAYFRRMRSFCKLSESQAVVLSGNLLSLRVSERDNFFSVYSKNSEYDYIDFFQWRSVENSIISAASRNLKKILSFRTLSLRSDDDVKIVGVAQSV